MANAHMIARQIELESQDVYSDAWYQEQPRGLMICVRVGGCNESKTRTRYFNLPWSKIRKSLERKDRKV